jgi:hypothetical protein
MKHIVKIPIGDDSLKPFRWAKDQFGLPGSLTWDGRVSYDEDGKALLEFRFACYKDALLFKLTWG